MNDLIEEKKKYSKDTLSLIYFNITTRLLRKQLLSGSKSWKFSLLELGLQVVYGVSSIM